MTHPQNGKLCMAGRFENGWGFLTLSFARSDGTALRDLLDATALGIDRLEFELDTPPPFLDVVGAEVLPPG